MKLSILIPVYNSSEILERLSLEINNNLKDILTNEFELILVNDKSIDESWSVIKRLKKKYQFIKGINLRDNIGQHGAIFVGLTKCRGDKIIIMDDDLQHPPSCLIAIYKKLNFHDACYTVYKKRKHFFWKIFLSTTNNIFSSFIFNKPFKIYLSSLKGITSRVKKDCIKSLPKKPFIDSLILKYSQNISNIDIIHQDRFFGNSNYNLKKLFILWFDMIENFHFYPIRFGSIVGLISYTIVKLIRISNTKKFSYSIKEFIF